MNKVILFAVLCLLSATAVSQDYKSRLAMHRAAYLKDLGGENSPLKTGDLKDVHFYAADSTYRVVASVTLLTKQKPFIMPAFDGAGAEYVRYALLNFKLHGRAFTLTVYRNMTLAANPEYNDYLFLPFTDETNGKGTYGGGRYLDFKTGDISANHLSVDFNKAYNPYCAYSSGYRCPMPPQENDLAISILAGEKMFSGKKKHP